MDNLLQFIKFNRIVLFSTLCAFTLNVIPVSQVYGEGINAGLNDINFAVRIEKLIEKIHRYADRLDQVKTIETLLDIKHEIEGYIGKKFDIDKELEVIEKEIKKMGGKFKKGELKEISKLIKKKGNYSRPYVHQT